MKPSRKTPIRVRTARLPDGTTIYKKFPFRIGSAVGESKNGKVWTVAWDGMKKSQKVDRKFLDLHTSHTHYCDDPPVNCKLH